MADFVSTLAATLKSAVSFPPAPVATVRQFAERQGSMSLAIGVALALVFIQVLADPTRLSDGWDGSVLVADYSLTNIFAAFLEYAILTTLSLAFAIAVAMGLGGSFEPSRLTMARLPSYGFATVWFVVITIIDKVFFGGQMNGYLIILGLVVVVLALVGIWIPYVETTGLSKTRATVAFFAESVTFILLILAPSAWSGAL